MFIVWEWVWRLQFGLVGQFEAALFCFKLDICTVHIIIMDVVNLWYIVWIVVMRWEIAWYFLKQQCYFATSRI